MSAHNKPLISNGGGLGIFSIPARWNAENTSNPKTPQSATAHSGRTLAPII
jgi:hypothetical protein